MSIPVSQIVDVTVELSNPSLVASDFSTGLIIGNSTKLNAQKRVAFYSFESWESEMTSDGFASSDPEYSAVAAYFSQNPTAARVAVGVKLSSDSTDAEAVTACRDFSSDWFGFCFCYDVEDSIAAVAAAVEAFSIPTVFFFQDDDSNALVSGSGGIFKTLMEANYNRTVGFYSTQTNFICGVLGLFSGLNSTDAGSAYTMAFKTVVGFTAENITQAQMNALKSFNGNVMANYSNRYQFIYPGISASGYHIDELYFLALAEFLIQNNVIAGMVESIKIPQTEQGLNEIITYISNACSTLLSIGFIGSGIWTGKSILNLKPGDAITNGYLIQADSIDAQDSADRQNRVAPTIYVALKATGAIEHVVIRAYVNR